MSIIKVNTRSLPDSAVTTAKIAADAVTDAKIADDVVGTEHLTANEVDTTALGADAVTAAQIADDAISEEHLDVTAITGHTAETSIADGDTILIHDASASALRKMTKANFVSGVGGTNTPAFEAYLSTNQSFSDASYTKINFNTEIYDTDSDYDNSSNYRFTPTTAGKYLIYSTIVMYTSSSTILDAQLAIYKNGSLHKETDLEIDNDTEKRVNISTSTVIDFNGSSDYVEIYGYLNSSSGSPTFRGSGTEQCNFGAFKIIT